MPDNFIGWEIDTLKDCGFPLDRIIFMCNSPENVTSYQKKGAIAHLINHNIGLDSSVFKPIDGTVKLYDAIYNARPIEKKRHFLAEEIDNLALIVGFSFENQSGPTQYKVEYDKLKISYKNDRRLKPHEVNDKCQQSYCGLMLSEEEGGCYSSSEYLLGGIPVVSTMCRGGREIFYNKNNSIVCEPTKSAIKDSVIKMKDMVKSNAINSSVIRKEHLELSNRMLHEFRGAVYDIGVKYGENINVETIDYPMAQFVEKHILYNILNEVK